MNCSLATGLSIHQMVRLIMAAKPLDAIVGQPTSDTMIKMVEQMAQMVAMVKTSVRGGLHGSLALVLDDANYTTITKGTITSTAPVAQPDAVNKNCFLAGTQRMSPREHYITCPPGQSYLLHLRMACALQAPSHV